MRRTGGLLRLVRDEPPHRPSGHSAWSAQPDTLQKAALAPGATDAQGRGPAQPAAALYYRLCHPKGGRPPRHGVEFIFGAPATWGAEQAVTVTDTRLYGTRPRRRGICFTRG